MTVLRTSNLAACLLSLSLLSAGAHAQDTTDSDHDGVLDVDELDEDTDHDGIKNILDPEDDGDTVLTHYEYFTKAQLIDTDGDGILDYLDDDDDDDHLLTKLEQPDPDGDGNPRDARMTTAGFKDYLNDDDDDDTLLTITERPGDVDRDTDKDGVPDHLDRDDDADSRPTSDEIGGNPTRDTDGNGIFDYLDPDDDGDTILTIDECAVLATIDYDHDGLINSLDTDSDGDTVLDSVEGNVDRDGDGNPDYLEASYPNPVGAGMGGQGNGLPGIDDGDDGGTDSADAGAKDAGRVTTPMQTLDGGGLVLVERKTSSGCSLGSTSAPDGRAFAVLLSLAWLVRRRRAARKP